MFEAVCVISEFSVAESASVWLFSSMDIHVRFESLLLHKTLVTNGALKGHVGLVSVLGQHVPLEINTLDLHATDGALLEDVVFVHVLLEVHLPFELLPALVACVLFFHVVVLDMVQVVTLGPLPPTNITDLSLGIFQLQVRRVVGHPFVIGQHLFPVELLGAG